MVDRYILTFSASNTKCCSDQTVLIIEAHKPERPASPRTSSHARLPHLPLALSHPCTTKGERAPPSTPSRLPPARRSTSAAPTSSLASGPSLSCSPSASLEWRPAVTQPELSVSPSSLPPNATATFPSPSAARPQIDPYAMYAVQSAVDSFAVPWIRFPSVRQPMARIKSSPAHARVGK